MPTVNIKDITESKIVRLVDLSEDSINKIAEAVARKIKVDAVEVVRCKDCKYYLNSYEKCELVDTRLHFYETDKVWTENGFCAWGDKKDEID